MGDSSEDYEYTAEEQEIKDKLDRVRKSHPAYRDFDMDKIYKEYGQRKVKEVEHIELTKKWEEISKDPKVLAECERNHRKLSTIPVEKYFDIYGAKA